MENFKMFAMCLISLATLWNYNWASHRSVTSCHCQFNAKHGWLPNARMNVSNRAQIPSSLFRHLNDYYDLLGFQTFSCRKVITPLSLGARCCHQQLCIVVIYHILSIADLLQRSLIGAFAISHDRVGFRLWTKFAGEQLRGKDSLKITLNPNKTSLELSDWLTHLRCLPAACSIVIEIAALEHWTIYSHNDRRTVRNWRVPKGVRIRSERAKIKIIIRQEWSAVSQLNNSVCSIFKCFCSRKGLNGHLEWKSVNYNQHWSADRAVHSPNFFWRRNKSSFGENNNKSHWI